LYSMEIVETVDNAMRNSLRPFINVVDTLFEYFE
jgi:hypothetical protein